jgi:uncharacterized protein
MGRINRQTRRRGLEMPENKIEKRTFKIELRKAEDGSVKLAGMPIVYGKRSEDIGFYEYIDAGAATKALKRSDVRGLYGHNSDSLLPLGRQSAKTLRLKETDEGVTVEIDPPQRNPFVDALIESIERGDISEMSFAFVVADGGDNWVFPKDWTQPATRHITELEEIFDVSYVAYAAYNDTSVALRSLEQRKKETPPANPGESREAIMASLNFIREEDELYRKLNQF